MLNRQQLEQFVKSSIITLKGRKREQAAFGLATLCFSGGYVLGGKLLPEFNDGLDWQEIAQLVIYAVGAISLAYAAIRFWRLAHPPELPPAKDRPSAIKGPMAFTEADGELFRKLGRESELQKLLGLMLDDQVLLVVVRGASGAGKTSLLRAGLRHILGDRGIFHYWEAVPTEPDKGLLRAVQERWPEGAAKPASLDELVNPTEALGRQRHVIVLDQFEQLRGSRKIFALLRRILRESKPPHRITWVIAFRREFSADWLDFISPEQERGVRPPQDVSLRLFTAEQAREVIGQLVNESNLKDAIEQSVINNLVEAATVEGEVSPVDIGIGLLVLAELHERQSGQTITIHDYQFHGGAEGLLTQYISRCLDLFPKENQEVILKAMLALRDPDENRQRLATGLTIDELAAEAGADARVLKAQLNRLADRDIRLLETETPADGSALRYRLPHERLIPALYRLTGKLLAEVDQARLRFEKAFQAWKSNDKRRDYLLKAKELRLIERYQTRIPWGSNEQEKWDFLYQSRQRLEIIKGAVIVTVILSLIGIGWKPLNQEIENYRSKRAYYTLLEVLQFRLQKLKKLEVSRPIEIERFKCSSSQLVEELSLNADWPSRSLSSLSYCASLKTLTLDLSGTLVEDLEPLTKLRNLTELSLILGGSRVNNLELLTKLPNLSQLTLDLHQGNTINLESLSRLNNLAQLTLNLRENQMSDLEPLSKLGHLARLSLDLSRSRVRNLESLASLSSLTQLTLKLGGSQVSNLEPLSRLSNLTELTLHIGGSQVSNLEPLSKLSNLMQLTIDLNGSQISNLEPLSRLSKLIELTLELSGSQVSTLKFLSKLNSLSKLTLGLIGSRASNLDVLSQLDSLTHLTLLLREIQVINLASLAVLSNLTQLTVDIFLTEVSDLEPLSKLNNLIQLKLNLSFDLSSDSELLLKLRNLTHLTVNFSFREGSYFDLLSKLNNLKQLSVDLQYSKVSNLEPLSKLSNLTQLTLDLSNSQVRNLEPLSKLSNLTHLTLSLRNSQVHDLEPLSKLSNLTQLTLDVRESKVSDLEPLSKLTQLQTLSIENSTRAQRQSLRHLPASVVELKF